MFCLTEENNHSPEISTSFLAVTSRPGIQNDFLVHIYQLFAYGNVVNFSCIQSMQFCINRESFHEGKA